MAHKKLQAVTRNADGRFPKGHPKVPGSGMKLGQKTQKTRDRETLRLIQLAMVSDRFEPMNDAHLEAAIGIRHLMFRDPKTGKFLRAEDEKQMDLALKLKDEGGESFWIYTKDPDVGSFNSLMHQVLGRPREHVEADVRIDAGPRLEILLAHMKRAGNGHS
jgi:hypothetical protein